MEFLRAFRLSKVLKSIGILVVLMICSTGYIANLEYMIKYGDGDILSNIGHFMGFDVFKCVMALVLASLYADSFSRDDSSRYLRMILTRTNVTIYTQCRFLANLSVVLVTSIMAFYAYTLINLCFIPIVPEMLTSYYSQFFYREMVEHVPFLYVGFVGLVFGLVCAACSSLGILYSAYKPNSFVSIGLSGLILFVGLSYIEYDSIFSLLSLVSMESTLGTDASPLLMFLWTVCYMMAVIGISGLLFWRRMKWRVENGYI